MKPRGFATVVAALSLAVTGSLATVSTASAAPPTNPASGLTVGDPSLSTKTKSTKINVMGLWAHPDDDAGFTTPCGVWHERYGVRCGIIMETRGEGGSNSVGPEAGPDLGLRRENEDRTSHVRSGTVDIYNVDRVDFFYNTSAALTADVWDKEEGLRQTVRIIRETQPDILMASNPSLAAGHGNHQYAQGRMVWEAARAAADPKMYPEQLTGTNAVKPWRVKKIVGGGSSAGSGGVNGPNCTTGFTPSSAYTVVGTWNGYNSPYKWAAGNIQGQTAGAFKTWAQVGTEGGRAHPTQARSMYKTVATPSCTRYAVAQSMVPIQPNTSTAAGRDDAILFGAMTPDPGGMPLGSTYYVDSTDFFVAPGTPFKVTVHAQSGKGTLNSGSIGLKVPTGWTASAAQSSGKIKANQVTEKTFTVTPAKNATPDLYQVSATFNNQTITAYNDMRVQVVQPVEGRFARWGNFAEYEQWASQYTWLGGRSNAVTKIGAGESVTVPVDVTNRSTTAQSGHVDIAVPTGFTADKTTIPFTNLASGGKTTVKFVLTHTNPTAMASQATMAITTAFGSPSAETSSSENLTLQVVPTTVIPKLASAPAMDGTASGITGPDLSLAGRWEGSACSPDGTDCGAGSVAKLGWYGDDLYVYAHVVDDKASAAATPDRCFGHWLVDSVEVLLDPQGNSVDTSTTFKTGIFPFTDDPNNTNGNGANGPCWSRDADNHQGFSTGPLAATVKGGLNAEGQEVVAKAARNADGTYVGGAWDVTVKIPLKNLPAAIGPTSAAPTGNQATNTVDPKYMGLNVTPYDSDNQDFIGDTRTAWSAIGGQQSEPYRWGHAYLADYTAPAGRSTTPTEAIIPDTALKSVESPQSIAQSSLRGVSLSGQNPTKAMKVQDVTIGKSAVTVKVKADEKGTARVYLWNGDQRTVPVWTTSCADDVYGFDACSDEDGKAPPWSSATMGGRLVGSAVQEIGTGKSTISVPVNAAALKALADNKGAVLVSYESASRGVSAWQYPVTGTLKPYAAPVLTVTSPTAKQAVVGDLKVTGTVASEAGLDTNGVTVSLATVGSDGKCGDVKASAKATVTDGKWSVTWAKGKVADGKYCVTAAAKDVLGQAAKAPESFWITLSDGAPALTGISVKSQCDGNGRASVAVYAINGEKVGIDVRASTSFAEQKLSGIAPGKAAYAFLQSTGKSISAGNATLAAYMYADGKGNYETYTVAYPAVTCP